MLLLDGSIRYAYNRYLSLFMYICIWLFLLLSKKIKIVAKHLVAVYIHQCVNRFVCKNGKMFCCAFCVQRVKIKYDFHSTQILSKWKSGTRNMRRTQKYYMKFFRFCRYASVIAQAIHIIFLGKIDSSFIKGNQIQTDS